MVVAADVPKRSNHFASAFILCQLCLCNLLPRSSDARDALRFAYKQQAHINYRRYEFRVLAVEVFSCGLDAINPPIECRAKEKLNLGPV